MNVGSFTRMFAWGLTRDYARKKQPLLLTIVKMDRIFVFDKGKIVEEGSHFELLKMDGLYKTL